MNNYDRGAIDVLKSIIEACTEEGKTLVSVEELKVMVQELSEEENIRAKNIPHTSDMWPEIKK